MVRAPFMPTTCWMAPLMPKREIEFGRDGLAGAADLAVHGEPAFVADGARGADFAAHQFREFFGERNIFRGFDAAAYGDQDGRLREVHGLLGFAEQIERLGADLFWFQFHAYGFYGRCAAGMFGGEVGAEGAGLEGSDPGGFAGEDDVGGGAALKHLADEDEFVRFRSGRRCSRRSCLFAARRPAWARNRGLDRCGGTETRSGFVDSIT